MFECKVPKQSASVLADKVSPFIVTWPDTIKTYSVHLSVTDRIMAADFAQDGLTRAMIYGT